MYFSFIKPYSFSRYQLFLSSIEENLIKESVFCETTLDPSISIETREIIYRRQRLCSTLGGVRVDYLTISAPEMLASQTKSFVVVTARTHAAETAGSYKIEGILKLLLSRSPEAESLRQNHVFLIIPFLNPDGVILGNNRCSLSGFDMNRCWGNPHKRLQPVVYNIKSLLQDICYVQKHQILIYCDLHGHSKLLNSFIYACHKGTIGTLCSWTQVRLMPRILAKRCHLLNYHQCSFKVEPEKANTARVIIWKEFKVVNSFTLESSQFGYSVGDEVRPFGERKYYLIAESVMVALNEYRKLLVELHDELGESKEWLKPCRLNELAGVPLADVLKREIEEEKEGARKRAGRKGRPSPERISVLQKVSDRARILDSITQLESEKNPPRKEISIDLMQHINRAIKPKFSQTNIDNGELPSWKNYFTEVELGEIRDKCENCPEDSPIKSEYSPHKLDTFSKTVTSNFTALPVRNKNHQQDHRIVYQIPAKVTAVVMFTPESHIRHQRDQSLNPKSALKPRRSAVKKKSFLDHKGSMDNTTIDAHYREPILGGFVDVLQIDCKACDRADTIHNPVQKGDPPILEPGRPRHNRGVGSSFISPGSPIRYQHREKLIPILYSSTEASKSIL